MVFGYVEACTTGGNLCDMLFGGCDAISPAPACGFGFELAFLLPGLMWLRRSRGLGVA